MKNILFVASEGVPFIKTGGLADVVGSLPKCIDKRYFDVRVFIPKYACMKEEMKSKMKYVATPKRWNATKPHHAPMVPIQFSGGYAEPPEIAAASCGE